MVPREMPVDVVDDFEVVEIEIVDGETVAEARKTCARFFDHGAQRCAIGQPRQGISPGGALRGVFSGETVGVSRGRDRRLRAGAREEVQRHEHGDDAVDRRFVGQKNIAHGACDRQHESNGRNGDAREHEASAAQIPGAQADDEQLDRRLGVHEEHQRQRPAADHEGVEHCATHRAL